MIERWKRLSLAQKVSLVSIGCHGLAAAVTVLLIASLVAELIVR
jgi:hypothetical protein